MRACDRMKSGLVIGIVVCLVCSNSENELFGGAQVLNVIEFSHAIGDGIADDTDRFQLALTECSVKGLICFIPTQTRLLITHEVYLWGNARLIGSDETSVIAIQTGATPYVINIGIRGPQQLETVWNGVITNVTFEADDNGTGRMIYFWRTDGAKIVKNRFNLGSSRYGPMSSGNNNAIVVNGNVNCVRRNISIKENVITATLSDANGNEGIGLNQWNGAEIIRNTINGVADDMIGIHFSENIRIDENNVSGIDGRILIANSRVVDVINNHVTRSASRGDGSWHVGISLIYIGHENDSTHAFPAPTQITVRGNILTYQPGAIDNGAAIYVYGPRHVVIDGNTVVNNSATATAAGIHVLPFVYSLGVWTDPDGLDNDNVSRVHTVEIKNNNLSAGTFSLPLRETGQTCAYYQGPVYIHDNVAGSFSFICQPVIANNIVK